MREPTPAMRVVLVCSDAPSEPGGLARLAAVVAEFGGAVSRLAGGQIAATFTTAVPAAAAAIELQRMSRRSTGFRLGIDRGEVVPSRHAGPTGRAVYVAACLADAAAPGQTVLTARVDPGAALPLPAATVTSTTVALPHLDGRVPVHVFSTRIEGPRCARRQARARPMARSTP